MKITLGPYKNLGYQRPNVIVEESEYLGALNNIRAALSTWEECAGPALTGYKMDVDYTVTSPKKALTGNRSENVNFILGEGLFQSEVETGLLGAKKNETYCFNIRKTEGRKKETVRYQVRIKQVWRLSRPETVQDILRLAPETKFKNTVQLEEAIKGEIFTEKYKVELEKLAQEIIGEIVEHSIIQIPDERLDSLALQDYTDFMDKLKKDDISVELYYVRNQTTSVRFKKDFIQSAKKEYLLNAVLDEISSTEGIEISDSELEAYKYRFLYKNNLKETIFEESREDLRQQMVRQKAIRFLTRINTEEKRVDCE